MGADLQVSGYRCRGTGIVLQAPGYWRRLPRATRTCKCRRSPRLVSGELCLLHRDAVTAIRLPPGGPDLVGDRPVDDVVDRLDLRSALDRLVAEHPAVHVTVDGPPDPVAGTFSRLRVDLLMVSCADGSSVHVPLVAVVEVRLADGP